MGGGGSGGGGPTTSTTNTSNLPTYVQPYVETMLGTAQQQIYNYDPSGNVSGFKPYVPYGATVDSSGNITNSAQDQAQSAVAPFSPLQQQAQQGVAGLQVPGQYGAATGVTAYGTANAMNMANQANPQDFQNQVGQYMNPYLQQSLQPSLDLLNQQYGIAGQQEQSAATKSGAFGGTREQLANSLNSQNQMLAQNQLVGNAYNQAFNNAQNQYNQSGQFALNANQAGVQNAGQLANIGGQQLQAQSGILNAQAQQGAVQQGQQQNVINQAIQNYAAQQQYPMLQLSNMSNLLHGLPMQSSTTQTYQAAPSTASQIAGLGTTGIAGLGLYNAMGGGSGGSSTTSDVRTKQNLRLVGTLPMGINLYHFEYKPPFKAECGEGWYSGVMAQEVQKIMPEAVVEMDNGFLGVKYDMLGIKMERI
jgi:hypothetical protein